MAFDKTAFNSKKFKERTEEVAVPSLAEFFGEGEKPVWIVKGLTGPELGFCKTCAKTDKGLQATLSMLASEKVSDKVKGLQNVLDLGVKRERAGDIPERLHQLVNGSVEPACTIDMAVKLSKTFPITFYKLTNTILDLSGKGMVPLDVEKKQQSS